MQRYRILERVGEGGFGSIYKAEDLDEHCQLVAIKQINLKLLSPKEMIEVTDSFNREVKYLSCLKHGRIPRMYDSFTDPDHWYVIMEYIKGETLEEKLKKASRGRFSAQQVLDIGIALCEVLGYLHAQNPPVIFRDVKPGNIMQTDKGRIYLIDFGIARHYTSGQCRDTSPLGSPGYAAPEQYGKAQTTPQSDIYGLGATLQTLLTGKEPLEILLEGKSRRRAIPKKLQELLTSMLERDPANRPQSMDEVKQALQFLKEHSVQEEGKRAATFVRDSAFEMAWIAALLCFICVLFLASGFFSSPLWIPGVLMILLVGAARSIRAIHQDMLDFTVQPGIQKTCTIVLKRLKDALFYSLIPAILFSCLSSFQGPLDVMDAGFTNALFFLLFGGAVLAWVIYSLFSFREEIIWLWQRIPGRRRGHTAKHQQNSPLQQSQRQA